MTSPSSAVAARIDSTRRCSLVVALSDSSVPLEGAFDDEHKLIKTLNDLDLSGKYNLYISVNELDRENLPAFTMRGLNLLRPFNDSDFVTAVRMLDPDEIPPSLRQRAIDITEAKYAEIRDPFGRLSTLRFLQKLGVERITERMKDELNGLDKQHLEAGNAGPTKWALDELRESDPQWVSEWLARKFLEGSTRFGGWNEMVTQIPAGERDSLLQRFTTELLDATKPPNSFRNCCVDSRRFALISVTSAFSCSSVGS